MKYDPASHAVVYEDHGKRAVCAYVKESTGMLRHHLRVENTRSCVVTTAVAKHAVDDGWDVHHSTGIDTYFEVH